MRNFEEQRSLTNNTACLFSDKLSLSVFTVSRAFQGMFLKWAVTAFIFYSKIFQSFIGIVPF